MDPSSFGNYSVIRHIGSGAFAHTYEAQKPNEDPCAIKWLKENPAEHGHERFRNETWALRQLAHPNIPKFLGEGSHLGRPYIVMSLARGVSLREISNAQLRDKGSMSQQRLVGILEEVLSALEHMHSQTIFHRDVKHDNIVSNPSESQVMLIDLGMCTGVGQPVDAATFWNAGASRFSPPSKLRYPSKNHPNHDSFAVGVLAYLLLTNDYPWSVGLNEDRGSLEDHMQVHRPTPIHQINRFVSRDVSDFVASLLSIDDDARPSASQALRQIQEIRKKASDDLVPPAIAHGLAIKHPRVMRDPVHGDIVMTDFEWGLIGTVEFQRLRWIRQLGTTHLVYPGAEHSRFNHVVGTMFVASEILRRIEERSGVPFELEEKLMARTFALVHDIAHVAFGHTLEDELGFFKRHDKNEGRLHRLVLDDRSQVGTWLRSTNYGHLVLAHFDSASTVAKHSWLQELVESPSGADVIDYVGRDSLYCGLDHKIDTAIFRRFAIAASDVPDPEQRHLRAQLYGRKGFRLDAEFALESILLERLGLFMKVYTHPVKVVAGCMIGKALWEVLSDHKKPRLEESRLERMGDDELLYFLRDSGRPVAASLVSGVLQRNLFKPAFRARALEPDQCDIKHYEIRQSRFREQGLLEPGTRSAIEVKIAR